MTDWSSTMEQTFEYYIVDPNTWKNIRKLDGVKTCTINRDLGTETLGSATIDVTEALEECYIRVYLVAIQNGVTDRVPLGTYLVQTPSSKFDGMMYSRSLDAYTPLLELKENPPPLGYSILKNANIMDNAYNIVRENLRAPVVKATSDKTLSFDFVANTNDTWVSFVTDLISNAKFELGLDELGRVIFEPKRDMESLQAVWTYNDDNSSILEASVSLDHDLYGIPNVVEVVYSKTGDYFTSRVVNDDPNSPISTVKRGREIIKRVTDPDLNGLASQNQIDEYAELLLKSLSTIEYTISYTHGYCPVRVGDCVRFNYTRAGLNGIRAKVISQSIKCESGCSVSEKAVFTNKLWR